MSDRMVSPNLKPDGYGTCGCGCGAEGRLKKPWRSNGVRCVERACSCRQCKGSKANRGGKAKQRGVAKRLGLAYSTLRTGHEEDYLGPLRVEVKSGVRDAQVVATAYEREAAQSEVSRPIGDNRPFMACYAPKGTSHTYHLIRDDSLEAVVFALAAAWGFGEAS